MFWKLCLKSWICFISCEKQQPGTGTRAGCKGREGGWGEEEAVLGKMLLPMVSQKRGRAVGNREVNRLRMERRFLPL